MIFNIDINLDELRLHLENMKVNVDNPIYFRHHISAFFKAAKTINAYQDLGAIARQEGYSGQKLKSRKSELKKKYGWSNLGYSNEITQFVYDKRNVYDHEQSLKLAIAAKVSVPKINLYFEIEVKMEDFYGKWNNPLKAEVLGDNGKRINIPEKYWNYEYRYFFREWIPEQGVSMTSECPDVLEIATKYYEYATEYASRLKQALIDNGLAKA